ncbi:MAG: gliding motility-associated C-terminal domain-containing protein [Saprospiraceae bacterium]|nr:gliding motility-associated C-terminal domain-containing protein [Saprospiraceae bacterium]
MSIFDRWGARVFQTDQIGQGWNGKMQNEGNLMPAGVYIYHLTYQRRGEKESKTTNTVTLLR